mmetsp:Transcript_1531/g.5213  ORF Transcript_1531/g.5213 Transcript_1531/m.5213 type:complete len:284 (-) Transcript_1531:274-1125(-)|eukprot:CAMPEP_0204514924 /NCGR_PEP_ID=MMETSP0661-20131031/2339_1 /ASSEMBLY_ACC=CAM_ASM_000606 /TAXON_ID=109239 /ORGANISM="Alexandrium margalefi, Strain AMGDE01CS-322" /LENGTH=283 /DNA_ID=CAMNT_0051520207 /DNA_START=113 /DNA_END=964 /DNA_ORIENTATION=-
MADAQAAVLHGGAAAPGAQSELLEVVRDIVVSEYRERLLAYGRHACEQIDALVLSGLRQLPPDLRDMRACEALQLVGGSLATGDQGQPLAKISGAAATGGGSAAPVTPGGVSTAHPLHPLSWRASPYAGTRWACDRCATESEGPSYHCAVCAFDLCEACWATTAEADGCRSPSDKKRQDGHAQSGSQAAKQKRPRPDADVPGGASALSASVKSLGIPVDPTTLERMEELEHKTQDLEEFRRILGDAPQRLETMPPEQRRMFMKRASDTYRRMLVQGRADVGGA